MMKNEFSDCQWLKHLPRAFRLMAWLLGIGLTVPNLIAGSHTWSGAVNGNWSNAGNWSAGGVPVIGEASITISFPVAATRKVMTNDIGALTVTSMNFSGSNYVLRGASTITFGSSLINVLNSGDSNVIESTLSLPGAFAVSVSDNKVMAVHTLTGAGYVVKFGEGELHLRGTASNPLSGGYIVNVGTLRLAKTGLATAIIGPLTIVGTTNLGQYASVWLEGSDQISIATDITIHPTGILNLNGKTNTINNLTVMAGSVYGSGLLALEGDLRLSAIDNSFPTPDISPLIQGNLEFNGAFSTIIVSNSVCEIVANIVENGGATTLNKTGPGTLWLKGGGNFAGNLNIQAGTVRAEQNTSLGSVAGLTTVSSGASLILAAGLSFSESLGLAGDGVNGQGALQIASGIVECYGNVTLTNATTVRVPTLSELQLKGVISGAGGLKKIGEGELHLAGLNANTFSGPSFVNGGKLSLFKPASIRAIGSVSVTNGARLALEANEQIDNASVVSIHAGGVFDMTNRNESVGGVNLGNEVVVDTGTGTLTTFGTIYAGPPYTTNNNGKATILGQLSLGGGQRTFSTDGANLYLNCHISDGAGVGSIFQEWDGGSIHLMRSNSFTGPAILSGFCSLSNSFALGAPGGGVISTNELEAYIAFEHPTITVSGENITSWERGVWFEGAGTNAWNGTIALLSNTTYNATYPPDLYYDGPGELTINGAISGPGTVKIGEGTLRLTASNSCSKGHFIGGNLVVQHPHALGVPGLKTYLSEGGRLILQLPHGTVVAGHTLRPWVFSGFTNMTLEVAGAVSNTWAGPVEMSIYDLALRVDVPNAAATLKIDGTITGTGGVEKTGAGKLILSGTDANSYPGETKVAGGTLRLAKPDGVQAVTNLSIVWPGRLEWGASEQIADAATLSLQGLTFSGITNALLGARSETVKDMRIFSSLLDAAGGAVTLLGDVDLTHDSIDYNFCSIYGTVRLSAGEHRVFSTVTNPSIGYTSLHFWNSVEETGGSASLTVRNLEVRLSGSNSFSGPLIVDGAPRSGGLLVRHPYALGGTAQGTLLTNSAIMDLAMTNGSVLAGESLVLANRRPGTTQPCTLAMYGEYTNTWAGPITVLDTNHINITYGSKLTVDGTISGPAPLYVDGAAEVTLTGTQPNTFNGLVVRGASFVRLAKPAGVQAFAGNLIMDNAQYLGVPHTVRLEAPGQLPPQATATIGFGGPDATFDLNGHAAALRGLMGEGTVSIGAGTLTLSNAAGSFSFLGQTLGAPGGPRVIKQGAGRQDLFANGATNLFNGDVFVLGGTLGLGTSTAGAMNLSAGTLLDMFGLVSQFGSLSGAGDIFTSGPGMILVGANHLSTTYSGVIFGGSSTNVVKVGTGALTLTGANTDTGKTVVQNGALLVNGSLFGLVHVERTLPGTIATLGGIGTLRNVVLTGIGAHLAPGATTAVPSYGKLTVTNIALDGGALYRCEVGGTNAGANLDQIEAKDTTTLLNGGADFTTFGSGVVSNRYTVWKSSAGVNGTFTGKSEGSTFFPSAGRSMKITYVGGASGRDIVLMDLSSIPPGSFNGIQMLPNGHAQIGGTGTPGALYNVQANANLNTTNWVLIGTTLANFNGAFTFVDTNAPSFPMRFYRFLLP